MNPILKRIITALSTAAFFVCAIIYAPPRVISIAVNLLIVLATVEYAILLKRKVRLASLKGLFLIFLGWCVISSLSSLWVTAAHYGNLMMLYLIAIVKISDMGGFALGVSTAKLMKGGNHKMCPTISPNKSWEGLFGSVLASCILSCLFIPITKFGVPKSLVFGVVAASVGTFGDLVESKFKRWVGVKDSATFMPAGLGGVLDMLDSLLFAPAVLFPFIG